MPAPPFLVIRELPALPPIKKHANAERRDAGKKSLEGPASERLAVGNKRRANGGRRQICFAVAGTRPDAPARFLL